eukprot:TRINITY_DN3772_c1_g1_i2.p1 TRINITY_DN3772_c1_g1~~TRINITY_DN3772_c1_g1_i2.p1  ORF type:complete len:450 (+),score=75.44 TRINITY_DN3772_c1_g1_i2:118-1467(+)
MSVNLHSGNIQQGLSGALGDASKAHDLVHAEELDLAKEIRNYALVHSLLQHPPKELLSTTPPRGILNSASAGKRVLKSGHTTADTHGGGDSMGCGFMFLYGSKVGDYLGGDDLILPKEKKMNLKTIVITSRGIYKIKNHRADVGQAVLRRQTWCGHDGQGREWKRSEYRLIKRELSWTTETQDGAAITLAGQGAAQPTHIPTLDGSGPPSSALSKCLDAGVNMSMVEAMVLQDFPTLVHYFMCTSPRPRDTTPSPVPVATSTSSSSTPLCDMPRSSPINRNSEGKPRHKRRHEEVKAPPPESWTPHPSHSEISYSSSSSSSSTTSTSSLPPPSLSFPAHLDAHMAAPSPPLVFSPSSPSFISSLLESPPTVFPPPSSLGASDLLLNDLLMMPVPPVKPPAAPLAALPSLPYASTPLVSPPSYVPSHLHNLAQIRSYAPDSGSFLERAFF